MKKFTADFETTTDPNDCRVWAYGLCNINDTDEFIYGNNIADFIEFCKDKKDNYLLYFHNLKFDGEYIFSYLLENGYECIKDKKDRRDHTFTTLISDMGQFYSIEIYFEVNSTKKHINKVTIYDSMKILNFSVDNIAKQFNMEISKLKIDYNEKRPIGHELTPLEVDYLKNDVVIMAKALNIMINQDLTSMTIGSNALKQYKKMNTHFIHYFPILPYEIDKDLRQSYKGGFTYLSPIYKNKLIDEGCVFDVNSLYPSVMYNEKLPFGDPVFYFGKYEEDRLYNLYIQTITVNFKIKDNFIPTIQVKNNLSFIPNEYITTTDDELITLTLTNIDLELLFKHYDIIEINYDSGWKFKSINGLFKQYIDKFTKLKTDAKKEGNNALYLIAKLMLNSLYGKFGLNPNVRGKYPTLDDNGVIKYKLYDKEIRDPIYIPVATFITSYARYKTITTSQKIRDYSINKYNLDHYIYSDTDSIHCLKLTDEELKDIIDIDDYTLGFWKHESDFKRAKFLKQKCYIEEDKEGKVNVTVAGLPKKLSPLINFENFEIGFSTENMTNDFIKNIENKTNKEIGRKLSFKHTKGGVILAETDFTIKK